MPDRIEQGQPVERVSDPERFAGYREHQPNRLSVTVSGYWGQPDEDSSYALPPIIIVRDVVNARKKIGYHSVHVTPEEARWLIGELEDAIKVAEVWKFDPETDYDDDE